MITSVLLNQLFLVILLEILSKLVTFHYVFCGNH